MASAMLALTVGKVTNVPWEKDWQASFSHSGSTPIM